MVLSGLLTAARRLSKSDGSGSHVPARMLPSMTSKRFAAARFRLSSLNSRRIAASANAGSLSSTTALRKSARALSPVLQLSSAGASPSSTMPNASPVESGRASAFFPHSRAMS